MTSAIFLWKKGSVIVADFSLPALSRGVSEISHVLMGSHLPAQVRGRGTDESLEALLGLP